MRGYGPVKRLFDICGALLGMIVLSPVIVAVGVLVLVFHGAPIFFTQDRVTKDERVFQLWKFRSMRDVDPERGLITDGERLTHFGRILRSTSLDELPSLWNVLRGHMSLVGPRPLPIHYLPLYSEKQRRRHQVRGGLSGLAQVNGRNSLPWDDKFDLDVEYVDTMGFGLDLKILLRTVVIVLGAHGVNQEGEPTAENFGGTLRSDLVVFDQVTRTETATNWVVRSCAGQDVGRCEMTRIDAHSLLLRFDGIFGPEASDIDMRRETIRLLTNRARATEIDFAVCILPAGSADRRLYSEAGFHESSEHDGLLGPSYCIGSDEVLVACALWPEEATTDCEGCLIPDGGEPEQSGQNRARPGSGRLKLDEK